MKYYSEVEVARVKDLLASGHSRRGIERMTGVSRSTIDSIAAGRHRIKTEPTNKIGRARFTPGKNRAFCHGCNATVWMPCHLCYVLDKTRKGPKQ